MSEEIILPLPEDRNPVDPQAVLEHFDLLAQRLSTEIEWLNRQSYAGQAGNWRIVRTDLLKVRAFFKEYCLEK